MKVADTTLLVDHARGDHRAERVLDAYEDTDTLVASTISVTEIAVGEIIARDATYHEMLAGLGNFDVRPFAAEHAYHAAAIEADLREREAYEARLATDIQIAGVARSLGTSVLTRNATGFERFGGVAVES